MDRFESHHKSPRRNARSTRWSAWNFAGIAVVLLGVGLALLGVNRALTPEPAPQEAVRPPIRTVVANVPEDATATASSGQQRIVRTSRGILLALFASDEGLRIATDVSNQGRSWRSPVTVPDIAAVTFSADIDARDRIHLAFASQEGVSYAMLRQTAAGWISDARLELDDTTFDVVDISYDASRELAHVVWAGEEDGARAPRWAGIDVSEDPFLLGEQELAEPGDAGAAINIAAEPGGTVVATYGRGDSPAGWFARVIVPDVEAAEWGPEETLDLDGAVSETSLTVDQRGVAHLIAGDEDGSQLTYLRRTRRTGWITAEAAITSGVTDPIDRPSVTVDTTSRLIYVFFRTGGDEEAVQVAIRDPASGWEGPYHIGLREDVAAGVVHPTAPRTTEGHPMVIWTTRASPPSIEAARVIAP